MPLPFIIGGIAAAGAVSGAKKIKNANDTIEFAKYNHEKNIEKLEKKSRETTKKIDDLTIKELEILKSFEIFSEVIEKIQSKPQFKSYKKNSLEIPKYNFKELKKVSVEARVLLGGISGSTVGSFVGSMGSIAFGGVTLGLGYIIQGIIFNITGSSLSNKADEALRQMEEEEKEINKICVYLDDLKNVVRKYIVSLKSVEKNYVNLLSNLIYIVNECGKTNWNDFTESEKMITENTVLFVRLLYSMCKVEIVLKSENEKELNKINKIEINKSMKNANEFLKQQNLL